MLLFWKPIHEEQEYIASLFVEHSKFFYSIAQKYAPDPQDAEDIVQDAIESVIKISSRFMKIEPDKRLAYIVVVIRNRCTDQARRQKRQPEYSNNHAIIESAVDERQNFEERILSKEQIKLLLADLKADDQVVLALKYVLEASTEQIAEILGCGKQNVYERLKRAKGRALIDWTKKGVLTDDI